MGSDGQQAFRIGELAAQTRLTPDTLRYYERLGLLPHPPRTSGGFRLYSAATLGRVRFIRQAQTVGLTLDEIHELVTFDGRPEALSAGAGSGGGQVGRARRTDGGTAAISPHASAFAPGV